MPTPIPDTFDNERALVGYDEPGTDVPSVDANLAILLANTAENLRSFSQEIDRDREQSDLDDHEQTDPLPLLPSGMEGDTNTDIELFPRVPDEHWVSDGTGGDIGASTGVTSFTYGKLPEYNNWKGGKVTFSGGAAVVNLESAMIGYAGSGNTTPGINISGLTEITVVMDVTGTAVIDPSNVFITLFDADANSDTQPMVNDYAKRWEVDTANFTGIDLSHITIVTLSIATSVDPTASDKLYLFAIRAHNADFDPSIGIGLNTIQGAVVTPVTFDLVGPSYSIGDLVRGVGSLGDPQPEDVELRLLVDAGNVDATTGSDYHTVVLVLRQVVGANTFIALSFQWNDTDAKYALTAVVNGTPHTLIATTALNGAIYDAIINGNEGSRGDATGIFWLNAKLKGNTLDFSIFESDENEELNTEHVVASHGPDTTYLTKVRGRVGWAFLPFDGDRDVLLYSFLAAVLSLSTLKTKVFNSITPVEGLQLFGSFAPDANLFTDFSAAGDSVLDPIRSLSGNPTWRGTYATSNDFVVPDFSQSYISFDIWVPQDADASGDPLHIKLAGTTTITLPVLDELQPGIWNQVLIDLSPYDTLTLGVNGGTYHVTLGNASFTSLGWMYNIDYMTVGHRRVAWSASCDGGSHFYYFRDCVNDDDAALHFPRVNVDGNPGRDTQLVIQAEALTDDAWLSSFNVKVKYAELGKPTYYTP